MDGGKVFLGKGRACLGGLGLQGQGGSGDLTEVTRVVRGSGKSKQGLLRPGDGCCWTTYELTVS